MKKHELQSLSRSFFVTKNSMGEGGVLQHRYRTGIALCNPLRNQCVSAQLEKLIKVMHVLKVISLKFVAAIINSQLRVTKFPRFKIFIIWTLKKLYFQHLFLNQSSRQWIGGTCE